MRLRRTEPLLAVLEYIVAARGSHFYGYELIRHIRRSTGTVYPILVKLEDLGWIVSEWESPGGGRPPRRYYKLTILGEEESHNMLLSGKTTLGTQ